MLQEKYKFEWRFSSPYHHKTMGLVERANQTLWKKLRKMSNFGELNWERLLDKAVYATNISFNRSIGTSPWIFKKQEDPVLVVDHEGNGNRYDRQLLKTNRDNIRINYEKEIRKGRRVCKGNFNIGDNVLVFRHLGSNKIQANWVKGILLKSL
jgi:hypothetical protein